VIAVLLFLAFGAGLAIFAVLAVSGSAALIAEGAKESAKLLAQGELCSAQVVSIERHIRARGRSKFSVELRVQRADGQRYVTRHKRRYSFAQREWLLVGAQVEVRVDPERPERFVIVGPWLG
jgi:hypothetical protein